MNYERRADVLDEETMAKLNKVNLPNEFSSCDGCGRIQLTMGDRARHLTVEGDCPGDLNSQPGRRFGDDYLDWKGEHLFIFRVHGLLEDGTPKVWGNGARHSEDCPCTVDPEQWAIDHPKKFAVIEGGAS